MKKPVKKIKTVKLSSYKKKVWALFSTYIRLRDCFYTTGTLTHGRCITCNKSYPFKKLQAGHFVPGRGGAVLFVEDNCHAQCYACNVPLHGNLILYYPKMVEMFGQARVDELINLKHTAFQWKISKLEEVEKEIQKKIEYLQRL